MSLNTTSVGESNPPKIIFSDDDKEEFVSLSIATRVECFNGYNTDFVKDLFEKDFATQNEFDVFANDFLENYIVYYFEQLHGQENYVDTIKSNMIGIIDNLSRDFNEFQDKLIENATEIAKQVVDKQHEVNKQEDMIHMFQSIKDTIASCLYTSEAKIASNEYFKNNKIDVIIFLNKPHLFASGLVFANPHEQAAIAHIIIAAIEKAQTASLEKKKALMDTIDRKEIDKELFERTQKVYKMLLDWKNRSEAMLHQKISNYVYSQYIVECLHNLPTGKRFQE